MIYVLHVGTNKGGKLTIPQWITFCKWILFNSEFTIIWANCSKNLVLDWLEIKNFQVSDVFEVAHPDATFPIKGTHISNRLIRWEKLACIPVSENFGVSYASWETSKNAVAWMEVSDFENFVFIEVDEVMAAQLTHAFEISNVSEQIINRYRDEIDSALGGRLWKALQSKNIWQRDGDK